MFTLCVLVVLQSIFVSVTCLTENVTWQSIQVHLEQNDEQIEKGVKVACDRMRLNEIALLTIGSTYTRFVLLTTDLYVFELNLSQVNGYLFPPYQIIVNNYPVHLKHRFPKSYSAFETIANKILYSFVTGSVPNPGDGETESSSPTREYIVFVYRINQTACTLAIDIRLDTPLHSLCDSQLLKYRLLSVRYHSYQLLTIHMKHPTSVCWALSEFFANYRSVAPQFNECDNLTLFFNGANWTDSIYCSILGKKIVNGYMHDWPNSISDNTTYWYLIDIEQTVHFVQGGFKMSGKRQLWSDFIGCEHTLPFNLKKNVISLVLSLAAVLQVIICVVVFITIKRMMSPSSPADASVVAKRRKSQSKQKSLRRKSFTLNRRSSKSRHSKSRRSISRQRHVSHQRSSQLDSIRNMASSQASVSSSRKSRSHVHSRFSKSSRRKSTRSASTTVRRSSVR